MRTLTYDRDRAALVLLDQTRLPRETVLVTCIAADDVAEAIRSMRVRGAPAIGVAAAYGLALAARDYKGSDTADFLAHVRSAADRLHATRPTAVNLRWALERAIAGTEQALADGVPAAASALLALADRMAEEDVETNRRMGALGIDLVPPNANVLTHCNTGSLATVDYGTALGVIRTAHERGHNVHVYVDETRPFLQGARLTAWELQQLGIPMTLIADSMAGHFMQRGNVDLVLVGADRIAANGDVANKIGTYSLAVLAREHGIPFYVVAPTSTFDPTLPSGDEIPIEERSPAEVTSIAGQPIAPEGVHAANPAFDVTPVRLVTAMVTEQGILRPPYEVSIRQALQAAGTAATGGVCVS